MKNDILLTFSNCIGAVVSLVNLYYVFAIILLCCNFAFLVIKSIYNFKKSGNFIDELSKFQYSNDKILEIVKNYKEK